MKGGAKGGKPPCMFFAEGICVRGDACPYEHAGVEPTAVDPSSLPPSSFFAQADGSNATLAVNQARTFGLDTSEAPPCERVWVKGLPKEVTDENMVEFFSQYGVVNDAKVLPNKFNDPDASGIVRMERLEDAKFLVNTFKGHPIEGLVKFPLTCKFANPDKHSRQAAGLPRKDQDWNKGGKGKGDWNNGFNQGPPMNGMMGTQQAMPAMTDEGAWNQWPNDGPPMNGMMGTQQPMPALMDAGAMGGAWNQWPNDGPPNAVGKFANFTPDTSYIGEVPPNERVWVKGLPKSTTDSHMMEFFSQYGAVVDAKVLPNKYPRDPDVSGIVRMQLLKDAEFLVTTFKGHPIEGMVNFPLQCKYANPDKHTRAANKDFPDQRAGYMTPEQLANYDNSFGGPPSDRVWIQGIPLGTADDDLKTIFAGFGNIVDCRVLPQRYPSNDDLSCIIRFGDPAQALWLVQNVNGNRIPGVDLPLTIKFANPIGSGTQTQTKNKRFNPY